MATLHYPGVPGTSLYIGRPTVLPVTPAVPNELKVSLTSGSLTDYPLQVGRAFPEGVVADTPEVRLLGVPLALQQADVKTRYPDGSVKFAVLSMVLPSVSTSEITLVIGNKTAPATPTPESISNMLSSYDFEATINVGVGGTPVVGAPVSARAMLSSLSDATLAAETAAGGVNSRYWTVGPVCTTVLLCDHTTKAWDVGTNATKAIRPMFHVQFWPSLGKYHVRHIVEAGDVTKLKDETGLDIAFTTGNSSPVTRLTQSGVNLYAATFHSRAYWGGADVPRANVKHGVAYLASTKAMPNYDSSIVMNTASVDNYATDWASRTKTLGSSGIWQISMDATGGRQDIGLMPKWDVVAMYSGAAHMHQIAEAHAEFAGSWAFYFREGSASKNTFDSVPGRGRIISKMSRPTQFFYDGNAQMVTSGVDGFTTDGAISTVRNGWHHDHAHTPGMFWFQYLTTGSAFWHEKLLQLAAWGQFCVNPGLAYNTVGNGRASTDLILNGVQPRGWGWQYRNWARAWWASMEGSAEKSLFEKALTDAAAQKAGLYDVPGMLTSNPVRIAWNTNYADWYASVGTISRPNALHYWDSKGGYSEAQFIAAMGSIPDDWGGGAQAPWMRNFVTMSAYHAVELGFTAVQPLADWAALQTIAVATSSEPRHIGDYVVPDVKADNTYYQTLADIYDGWPHNADGATPATMPAASSSGFPAGGTPNTYNVAVDQYGSIASASIAMSNGAPSQALAWAVVKPWHDNTVYHSHDPRYAIIPRT